VQIRIPARQQALSNRKAASFGLLTFACPFILDAVVGATMGYPIIACAVIGAVLASHTLLGLPIIKTTT
jgi:hypothetical protein